MKVVFLWTKEFSKLVSWLQEGLIESKEKADVLAVQLIENQELTTRLKQEKQSLDKAIQVSRFGLY